MINPFKDVDWNPNLTARRKFAASLMIGFPALSLVFSVMDRLKTHAWHPSFLGLGVIGLAVGGLFWLVPQIAKPFYLAWYFLACCIGIVMSNLLLGAFFYLALTPIGLLVRAFGRQSLRKAFDRSKASYWDDGEKNIKPDRYYRQF